MSLLISNLSYKRKNDKNLLSNINLKVDNGDLLIIQGESGCGKTTLLNIISGLVQPSQGLIKLNNVSLNSLEQSVASEERKIGYVFQDYALFPHLTAFNNAVYAYKNNSEDLTDEYVLNTLNLVLKDHLPVRKFRTTVKANSEISKLSYDELNAIEHLGNVLSKLPLDDISVSKGYRVLARLPNLPENLHDQIIQKFKTLPKLLTASPEKLYEVEGIGSRRAQQLRDYFDTLLKNVGFSYINGH